MQQQIAKLFNTRLTVENNETQIQGGASHFKVSLQKNTNLTPLFPRLQSIALNITFKAPTGERGESIQAIQTYITSRFEPSFIADPDTRFKKLRIATDLLNMFQTPNADINLAELHEEATLLESATVNSTKFAGGELGELFRKIDLTLKAEYKAANDAANTAVLNRVENNFGVS